MKRNLSLYITALAVVILSSAFLLNPLLISAAKASPPVFPDIIPLPDGFFPEGIVLGNGTDFFVGSLADGAIYAGDLRTGQGEILVQGQGGRMAVGLSFDPRSNLLFIAGGSYGNAFVYDAAIGTEVAEYKFDGGFINDVVVTSSAAYFTDSSKPILYRLALGPNGLLPGLNDFETLLLGGDFEFDPTAPCNTNGIEATPNGEWLLIVHSSLGTLYKVDPNSGYATIIDLGSETVVGGDGLVLNGKALYVVQNWGIDQITVVQLDPDLTSGTVMKQITDPDFQDMDPATALDFGNSLYVVNTCFAVPPRPYAVIRVEITGGSKASPALYRGHSAATLWGEIKCPR